MAEKQDKKGETFKVGLKFDITVEKDGHRYSDSDGGTRYYEMDYLQMVAMEALVAEFNNKLASLGWKGAAYKGFSKDAISAMQDLVKTA